LILLGNIPLGNRTGIGDEEIAGLTAQQGDQFQGMGIRGTPLGWQNIRRQSGL